MNLLVVQQDDAINVIETTAGRVEADTEAGYVHDLPVQYVLLLTTNQEYDIQSRQ